MLNTSGRQQSRPRGLHRPTESLRLGRPRPTSKNNERDGIPNQRRRHGIDDVQLRGEPTNPERTTTSTMGSQKRSPLGRMIIANALQPLPRTTPTRHKGNKRRHPNWRHTDQSTLLRGRPHPPSADSNGVATTNTSPRRLDVEIQPLHQPPEVHIYGVQQKCNNTHNHRRTHDAAKPLRHVFRLP
jgi:hypothetical protein